MDIIIKGLGMFTHYSDLVQQELNLDCESRRLERKYADQLTTSNFKVV